MYANHQWLVVMTLEPLAEGSVFANDQSFSVYHPHHRCITTMVKYVRLSVIQYIKQ